MVMKVRLTSPCAAMLLQETAKSLGQCEGYLCGEINVEQSSNITDSEVRVETEEIVSVNDVLASTCGLLKTDVVMNENSELDPCLSGKQVLGWYKFCRRSLLNLTLREKFVHRKLSQRLSNGGYRGHFVTILVQEEWNMERSTHTWQFVAYSLKDARFERCAIEIVNLKVATCGAYKPFPSVHQVNRLPQAAHTLDKLEQNFTDGTTTTTTASSSSSSSFLVVNAVRDASDSFADLLQKTVEELSRTELEMKRTLAQQADLQAELARLEAELSTDKKDDAVVVGDNKFPVMLPPPPPPPRLPSTHHRYADAEDETRCRTGGEHDVIDDDDETSSSSSESDWEAEEMEARTRELREHLDKRQQKTEASSFPSS